MNVAASATVDEAFQVVRDAVARGQCVQIIGGGTKSTPSPSQGEGRGEGFARDGGATTLCTKGLNRIIELSPGDMTCTVEAGVTLRDLDAALAPHGLRLPLDPPDYDGRATVGGVLAANDSGPLRAAYGTAREHVIGMSMIICGTGVPPVFGGKGTPSVNDRRDAGPTLAGPTHTGPTLAGPTHTGPTHTGPTLVGPTLVKAGGRVVKNVAGYDLHRLFVGSYGSLGLIVTASFKLRPRPESFRLVTLHPASLDEAEHWTAALLAGPTRPAILDWLRPCGLRLQDASDRIDDSRQATAPTLVVGFEDAAEAVDWQVAHTREAFHPVRTYDAEESAHLSTQLRRREAAVGAHSFRAAVPPSRLRDIFAAAPKDIRLHAHATGAMVHGAATADGAGVGAEFRRQIIEWGGWIEWRDANGSRHWQRAENIAAAKLELRMKQQIDPRMIFPLAPFHATSGPPEGELSV